MADFVKWLRRYLPNTPREPDESAAEIVTAIRRRRDALAGLADSDIESAARALRGPDAAPVIECFALAVEAIRRRLGLDLFDVQIVGALAMHHGAIAEMQTGEGKTVAAVLTVFANALSGKGVQVWTANDYLARRDAAWMGPAYRMLGLSVGCVQQGSTREERRTAYAWDVTYETANEAGFDFLRDQLALEPSDCVQRDYAFVLIDEADSILIDEARIPLVIAGEGAAPADLARAMARLAAGFRLGLDYLIDEYGRNVDLTDAGIAKVEATMGCGSLFEPRNLRVFTAAQDAVHAQAFLKRDIDYIVRDGAIGLIDEFKGRVAQDRRWPAGLQTALEAKEGLPLRKQGRILGSITLQSLVRMFPRVCGMTGTAATQLDEFRGMYGLEVVVIPTNRPVIRDDYPDVIFADKLSKERVVTEEIVEAHAAGRPVLIGTASVEESERLSMRLERAGVPHQVLNARNDEAEAAIVARAGSEGAVTVSTNMAGRGADIPLGSDRVRELGGLYVIGLNKHEARRIDFQLRGRSGRQGDPGSSRFFVSLDDDLMARYGVRQALGFDPGLLPPGVPARDPRVRRAVESVQRLVEGQNLEIRRTLWKYDGLVDQHRREMHQRRKAVLHRVAMGLDGEPMSELERRITLIKIDDLWSDYLAAIAELKGGIHWESWAGKDPLHTFLTRANEIYDEVCERIAEEVRETLEQPSGAAIEDAFDRSATWTYLINDQPFGTLAERWAKAVGNRIKAMLAG
ncbi:MAG: accessory Sec system translocase SecA2 [Acidobacteria bacterium]|nr:accessory Sec system translocase SecA2 [Acidobacteriota bacterium]